MALSSYSIEAALSLEVARERPAVLGFASSELPVRPVYTNNEELEAARQQEYDALAARCAAEVAAWNVEAQRWHADRAEVIAERLRADADALSRTSGGLVEAGERPSSPIAAAAATDGDDEAPSAMRRFASLGELEMVSGDATLAATAMLEEMAERQASVDAAVAQVRALAVRQLGHEERRRAASVLCAEQRRAFVARWRRKALATAAAPSGTTAPTTPAAPTAAHDAHDSEVLHVTACRCGHADADSESGGAGRLTTEGGAVLREQASIAIGSKPAPEPATPTPSKPLSLGARVALRLT